MLGYLIAQSVYNTHHKPEVGGRAWKPPSEFLQEEGGRSSASMGSPYLPLDSWVYPALERLAALGYIGTETVGAATLDTAGVRTPHQRSRRTPSRQRQPLEVQQLYGALSEEFAREFELMSGESNIGAQVESVYQRSLGISGRPLTDNQHFGQTLLNDYGRPYQQGFNALVGGSGWTTAGPFVIYARGEYESAPSAPAPSAAALAFVSNVDGLPPNAPSLPIAATHRFRLLDAYVGMTLKELADLVWQAESMVGTQ